jgi:tyrosine phenol-lyase
MVSHTKTKTQAQPHTIMDFTTAHAPRAYANALVRFHHTFSQKERLDAARKAGWNVFQFPSEMLQGGDLLSDSGTTTLTVEQLSASLLGDEAYGSNWGSFKLYEQFEETFGIDPSHWSAFLFHQGRSAEHALFSQLGTQCTDAIIPNNGHFDTTRANIEANDIEAVDLFSDTLQSRSSDSKIATFKGNMNIPALKALLEENAKRTPMVYCTITNNTGGGQPVSMQNLKEIKTLCDQYNLPFFLDACRFAENAWFIKTKEPGYDQKSIPEIVRETFSLCDGFTISLKKDGLSNMGGALVIKNDSPLTHTYPLLLNSIKDHQILTEGHPTYGGLTGRDIMVITEGLKTVVTEEYLQSRVSQVASFGQKLKEADVPVLEPFGAHAIYIDMDRFFEETQTKKEDFGGIAFTGLLLIKGIRLCELGAFAFGSVDQETGADILPPQNFVRAAIPRNKYEEQDLLYVSECIKGLYDRRDLIPKAIPTYGRDLSLRHFKAKFELQ